MHERPPAEIAHRVSVSRGTPEEEELAAKLTELASLEVELAGRELDLATVLAELHSFERRYIQVVGARYSRLDDLSALIAEARARQRQGEPGAVQAARAARARADGSAAAAGAVEDRPPEAGFQPSEEMKRLYRLAARAVHPDLAPGDEDRERRERLMKEVNRAFREGDETALWIVLREARIGPDAVTGEGVAFDLVRAIRKIARIRSRLAAIDANFDAVRGTMMYALMQKVDEASSSRDLLAEMAVALDRDIEAAHRELDLVLRERPLP